MNIRQFGIGFMVLVVAVPIGILAYVTTKRAERATVFEVRLGNDRLAQAVANQLADYVRSERRIVSDFGEVIAQTSDDLHRSMLQNAFRIKNQHIRSVAVYDLGAGLVIGDAALTDGLEAALAGRHVRKSVPTEQAGHPIGHMVHLAEPIEVAGKRRGAVLAEVDLVGIWQPVAGVTIGKSGFARVLTMDGVLLAHGNPEERRVVDNPEADVSARLLAGALAGKLVRNKQGQQVIATAAMLPEIDAIVLVEQPAIEAYSGVASMKVRMIVIAGVTLLVVMVFGFVFGGHVVRGIERLRGHTQRLGKGELTEMIDPLEVSRVKELRGLAESLNEMAYELDTAQRDKQKRERIDTFARVAAGLAHDLRHPVEAIRAAWLELAAEPDDESARAYLAQVSEKHLPRLARFVGDLTRLAKGDSVDREHELHDALELATTVVGEISAAPKFRGVEFKACGESAPVECDRLLVRRALYNLANNGAEACLEKGRDGQVTIEVKVDDEFVSLSVTDTGVGIAKERHAEVLSSDLRSTKRSNGVGLGLGVVRQVAESHEGKLSFDSEVGVGSTFTLALPGVVESGGSELNEQRFNEKPKAQAV